MERALALALTRPTAFVPLAMSGAGLALILGHVAIAGAGREADEGAAARLWWVLMAAQVPLIAFFATTERDKAPPASRVVLVLQVAAMFANLAALRFFNL